MHDRRKLRRRQRAAAAAAAVMARARFGTSSLSGLLFDAVADFDDNLIKQLVQYPH